MRHLSMIFVSLLVLIGSAAEPAERALTIDHEKSAVTFTLGATGHTVHGTMALSEGVILFDLEAGTASGSVVFDAARTDTGKKKRDKKMHAEVLESERYPDIVFTPQTISGTLPEAGGKGAITLGGTVKIHGSEHPVTLEASVVQSGNLITATSSLIVPYVAWGMEDPSVFILRTDKEVEVTIEVFGTLAE